MDKIYIGTNSIGKKVTCTGCGIPFNPGVPWALFIVDGERDYFACEHCSAEDHMLKAVNLLNSEMN